MRFVKRKEVTTEESIPKVPMGEYRLGKPRPPKRYGIFVPIAYPTAAQKSQGYTGGSVGIHGPDRRVRWLGRLTNLFDTTDGCVGVAADREMEEIAHWIRKSGATTMIIE